MPETYDFAGWATRNDITCSDGRVIKKDAFLDNDHAKVPLVWNHKHETPDNVLGHAILENREEGVRAYGTFNDTKSGQIAKNLVMHGDITSMSIYANQLQHVGNNVVHGNIREVSLVHAGANPGAVIDSVLSHGEDEYEEGTIAMGEALELYHADEEPKKEEPKSTTENKENKTIGDVIETMNEEQKDAVYALIGEMVSDKIDDSEGGNEEMKQNAFEANATDKEKEQDTLTHAEIKEAINDGKRYGSLKESFLQHGIDNIEYLFPDAKNMNTPPDFIQREMGWARGVMSGVHHTAFSRIKSIFADITEDDARARGYIKGKMKKEEVFGLLKRVTTPTTVYKKQKLDRDDVIDITDFDVVAWLKSEMRMMLDEELARAYLIGDGRATSSDDKINEQNIRPIATDEDLYTIKLTVPNTGTADDKAKAFIRSVIKSRKDYKGSGQPKLYTTEDVLTDMLLLEDGIGHALYADEAALARKLRVSEIVTVPVMEGAKGKGGGDLLGVIVNLADYSVGADRGGAVSMFDDFDIDYNAQKYLIETRCSGALIRPYSAIAIELAKPASGGTGVSTL